MNSCRALFIPLSSLQSRPGSPVSPLVLDMLRDYAAMGFRLIVVTDRLELCGQRYRSCAELLALLRSDPTRRYDAPFTDVILLQNGFDPAPFWDAARRFNLLLNSSTVVNYRGEYMAAARVAGIGRSESCHSVFGRAA